MAWCVRCAYHDRVRLGSADSGEWGVLCEDCRAELADLLTHSRALYPTRDEAEARRVTRTNRFRQTARRRGRWS